MFEFLEELSASLTGLATRELNVLKDLKVGFFTWPITGYAEVFFMSLLSVLTDTPEKRGRGYSVRNRGSVVLCEEG